LAALLTLLLHHLLHLLLHLLSHLRVHVLHHVLRIGATASSASHHLLLHLLHLHHVLPHGWVHGHSSTHGHLRLHHGEVLLHSLEVLGHDLGCHAIVAHLLTHGTLARLVAVLSELATSRSFLFLPEVAPGLSFLDFDWLSVDLQWHVNAGIDTCFVFECDKAEPSWTASIFIHHESRIHDAAELSKVLLEFLVGGFLANTTNKDLACLFLFVSRNSSLGIDLYDISLAEEKTDQAFTYNLAVEEVLLDHDYVDCLGILESKKAESS